MHQPQYIILHELAHRFWHLQKRLSHEDLRNAIETDIHNFRSAEPDENSELPEGIKKILQSHRIKKSTISSERAYGYQEHNFAEETFCDLFAMSIILDDYDLSKAAPKMSKLLSQFSKQEPSLDEVIKMLLRPAK